VLGVVASVVVVCVVVVVFVVVDSVVVFVCGDGGDGDGWNSVNVSGRLGQKFNRNLTIQHRHKIESHIVEYNFEK
jgi:hypothetical protein